jgi:hypothetical protein
MQFLFSNDDAREISTEICLTCPCFVGTEELRVLKKLAHFKGKQEDERS